MKKTRFFLCVFLLFNPAIFADPLSNSSQIEEQSKKQINLQIYEKGSGDPLNKVQVTLSSDKNPPLSIFSNEKGQVSIFIDTDMESSQLEISKKNFEKQILKVSELKLDSDNKIYLFPLVDELDELIIVTGKRKKTSTKRVISIDEAKKIAPRGDAAQIVKLLPGVQTRGFSPEIVVRGSAPSDSKYYVDQFEVPFIFHGVGNLSITAPELLADVEFESGGFGAQYGDAMGGVISLKTKNEVPEKDKTTVTVNLPIFSGISHQQRLSENEGLYVSLRRSYLDIFIRQFLKSSQNTNGFLVVPYFGDLEVMDIKVQEDGYQKIHLLSAYDGVKAAFPFDASSSEDGRAEFSVYTGFFNLGVEHNKKLNQDWRVQYSPQIYYDNTNNNIFNNTINQTNIKLRVPAEWTKKLSKDEELSLGIDPSITRTSNTYDAILLRFDDPSFDPEDAEKVSSKRSYTDRAIAVWSSIDQMLGSWILTPGLRVFYSNLIHKSSADPRLRTKYLYSDEVKFKFDLGQYSQTPQGGQADKELGNPDLKFQRSYHYVAGVEKKFGEEWSVDSQLFWKTAFKLVNSDPVNKFENSGSLRSRGWELFIRRNLTSRYFGWLTYTYSKTEEKRKDSEDFAKSNYDQTHVINIVGDYVVSTNWDIGARYFYHTGDTTSDIDSAVYNSNLDKYQDRPNTLQRNEARLPNYNSLSLYLNRDYLKDTWKLSLKVGIESFWYKDQVMGSRYNYDYSQRENVTGIPFIPYIELRAIL